jgi:hypothetical protein
MSHRKTQPVTNVTIYDVYTDPPNMSHGQSQAVCRVCFDYDLITLQPTPPTIQTLIVLDQAPPESARQFAAALTEAADIAERGDMDQPPSKLIKERWNDFCIIREMTYGMTLAKAMRFYAEAKRDFPALEYGDVVLVPFAGNTKARTWGIEFPSGGATIPDSYQSIPRLEYVLA